MMSANLVSSKLIHAWLPIGIVTLNCPQHAHYSFTAAATCFHNTQNILWIATSNQGQLIRIDCDFISSHPSNVIEHTLTPDLTDDPITTVFTVDIGRIQSISSIPSTSTPPSTSDDCPCLLYVCGVNGHVTIPFHSTRIPTPSSWQSPSDAILITKYLTFGLLRDTIVPKEYTSNGAVLIGTAGHIFTTTVRNSWSVKKLLNHSANEQIIHMHQRPEWVRTDTSNCFMVILGRLRAGVVVYVNENGTIALDRFTLPTASDGSSKLYASSILTHSISVGMIVFEDLSTGRRVCVKYNKDTYSVDVDLDLDRMTEREDLAKVTQLDVIIRDLLRGVADVGNYQQFVQSETKKADSLISSYNQAFLFRKAWRSEQDEGYTDKGLGKSCHVSVTSLPAEGSPRFQIPQRMIGNEKYVTVSFTNTTGITLANGWYIKLVLYQDEREKLTKKHESKLTTDSVSQLRKSAENKFLREYVGYVNNVPPGKTKRMSFPVQIDSHSPMHADVMICFYDPAVSLLKNDKTNLEISLTKESCLDIIRCSEVVANDQSFESSDDVFMVTQMTNVLSISENEKKKSHPFVMRFQLPVPLKTVRTRLDMTTHHQSYRSALGSDYSIGIADAILIPAQNDDKASTITTVTLRAEKHVIPFVKAAITTRVLNDIPDDKAILHAIFGDDKNRVEAWLEQMKIVSSGNESNHREAEAKLVQCVNFFNDIESNGSLVNCFHERERELLSTTHEASKNVYLDWRRATDNILTTSSDR